MFNKQKKNNIKKENAITLVALVVTIVVLLILAGISISMFTGDNGILRQATSAKEETGEKGAKEKLGIILTGFQVDAYSKGKDLALNDELAQKIYDEGKSQGVTSSECLGEKILVTIDGYDFEINDLLTIKQSNLGELAKKLNVEIIDNVRIKITSAVASEYAKKEENTRIASTEIVNGVKVAELEDSILKITTPDGDAEILDLADETDYVEYWAYKSKTFTFKLEDSNGECDSLDVKISIPYTSVEYLLIENSEISLLSSQEYYSSRENYPTGIINIPNNLGENFTFMVRHIFNVYGITTLVLPETITKIDGSEFYNQSTVNFKTVYIPASVEWIGANVFHGLQSDARIYFEASGPSDSWDSNWNSDCQARILWNQ